MKMNIFEYAARCEMWWKELVKDSFNPYTPKTTFYFDLSLAEGFGESGIRDTYKDVINAWGKDIEYITEFSMCLNHKIWQLYETNEPIARVYDELWRKSVEYITNHFEGKDLAYYYEVTD